MNQQEKEVKKLAGYLQDDLEPLLNEHLALKVAQLVVNYGYKRNTDAVK